MVFEHDFRLVVSERLLFDNMPAIIDWYGYEIWQGSTKLYWYDSQPHPDDVKLSITHLHHKHIPPNIKHNRVPAPEMSFTQPNIPSLITEIENLIKNEQRT